MEILKIGNLTFTYPGAREPALKGIDLSLEEGEVLCLLGPTGCGKTTLLRMLKPIIAPHGESGGMVRLFGREVEELSQREQAARVGFVMQDPDNQIVTDKVWHELAFGPENLGMKPETIRLRVAEMAAFFGMEGWFEKGTDELSGGQKQILNLAAVMVCQPELLILDEPTARLDPVARAEFLEGVKRVNKEFGTTVIITEHRPDDLLEMADKVCVLSEGAIKWQGSPREMAEEESLKDWAVVPFSIPEGRRWLREAVGRAEDGRSGKTATKCEQFDGDIKDADKKDADKDETFFAYRKGNGNVAIEIKNTYFAYGRRQEDVIRDASLAIGRGEIFALLGGNGAGKSTLLSVMAGVLKPYRGKVDLKGTAVMLPQNPELLFNRETVAECLEGSGDQRHPYDLSGGEKQSLALSMVFERGADILLLDEPTKGLDPLKKKELIAKLRQLKDEGKTIVVVSHDMEFCARVVDRCAMMSRGEIVSLGAAGDFFEGNQYYTTRVGRMARNIAPGLLLPEDLEEF